MADFYIQTSRYHKDGNWIEEIQHKFRAPKTKTKKVVDNMWDAWEQVCKEYNPKKSVFCLKYNDRECLIDENATPDQIEYEVYSFIHWADGEQQWEDI